MRDDRNGVPNGRPTPFGRGAPHTNGTRLDGPFTLPTRTQADTETEGPIDLVAVQADDELVNALGARTGVVSGGRGPELPGPARGDGPDDRLLTLLAAWRAEIDADPIPELVDLDTAVAAVVAGAQAEAAKARRHRAGRLRHLAPLAAAAAIIVATVGGVGLGSQNAVPGDTLWAIQKVVNPERAESVEAKVEVEGRLQKVRAALEQGDTVTAAQELAAIQAEIPSVRGEEGQPLLLQEQEFLAAKLADTPPGIPADLSTPPTSNPAARSTAVPPAPPVPGTTSADPSVPLDSQEPVVPGVPGDPSVAGSDENPASVLEAPTAPQAGDPVVPDETRPDVTTAPDVTSAGPGPVDEQPGPGTGSGPGPGTGSGPGTVEGSSDPTTDPGPPAEEQQPGPPAEPDPVPPGAGAGDGAASDTPTASGSAGTSVEATGTATT